MVLEVIYVVRHGYRSNWNVDPSTGHYNSNIPSPTGIVADPALASYGVAQAKQLGGHLLKLSPPVDKIYSSPFYRCLQTLQPFTTARHEQKPGTGTINVEPGVGEFYGLARFDHPSPASIEELRKHFPHLEKDATPVIVPSTKGESIPQLHDRVAYCLEHLIEAADKDPNGPKAILICTHAAAMIAIGRVLVGRMPEDDTAEDFNCFTASFSKFSRRKQGTKSSFAEVKGTWHPEIAEKVPDVGWRGGVGVGGGWDCEVNGDCSFLDNGPERGWHFTGDESFLDDPNGYNPANYATESKAAAGVDGDKIRGKDSHL